MSSCLYHLAKNPEKQEKLRQEILTILPNRDSKLTTESFNHIPYMRACLKEAMRLNAVVPGTSRATGQDLVLNGYQVPKGTDIALSMIVLQKSKQYFPRNEEFLPERWIKGDNELVSSPGASFVYLPFGFGVRSCVGRRFAEMEIFTALSRLIHEFQIEYHYGPLEYGISFVMSPNDDLKFKFIDRE